MLFWVCAGDWCWHWPRHATVEDCDRYRYRYLDDGGRG